MDIFNQWDEVKIKFVKNFEQNLIQQLSGGQQQCEGGINGGGGVQQPGGLFSN